MKRIIFMMICLTLICLTLITGCISLNPDEYRRTSFDTPRDLECEEIGEVVLERLNVKAPTGFICSSWLQEELYPSKSKCSCYRGNPKELEVITYWRGSGDIIRVNSFVKYASNFTIS